MKHKILLVAAVVAAAGCFGSTDELRFVPVSGTITVDGAPAANLYVVFKPLPEGDSIETGPQSVGFTDAEGRYTVDNERYPPRPGAVVGRHEVRIFGAESKAAFEFWTPPDLPPEAGPSPLAVDLRPVPTVTISNEQRGRKYEVPRGGTDEADFAL